MFGLLRRPDPVAEWEAANAAAEARFEAAETRHGLARDALQAAREEFSAALAELETTRTELRRVRAQDPRRPRDLTPEERSARLLRSDVARDAYYEGAHVLRDYQDRVRRA